MSEDEFQSAFKGQWADGPLVADTHEAGSKWLWTSRKAAKIWHQKMSAAGEMDLLVARVFVAKQVRAYPTFPHPPEGTAVHVPIADLGKAERIS